jgi:hypothetical protein
MIGTRARLRRTSVVACALFGVLLAWLGMQFQGAPEPSRALEQANFLAAETFASGRLANPAHPAGFFLQTFLTLQSPSYVAAVAPGTALLLSVGILLGDPNYGLWLTIGLFVGATTWMLLGFASLRWALLGGILAALWFGSVSFWAQSFASPAATGLGAAVLWGATRRYWASGRARDAGLIGAGAGWLLLCNPVAAAFALPVPLFLTARTCLRRSSPKNAALIAAGLVVAMSFQALLNKASTGDATVSATDLYEQRYNVHPKFFWELPKVPKPFDFWRMEQNDLLVQEAASGLHNPVGGTWLKRFEEQTLFYFGIPGALLLAGALLLGSSRWARVLIWASLSSAAVILVVPPLSMNLTAPLAPLAVALIVWSLRRLWSVRSERGLDCWTPTALVLITFACVALYRGFAFSSPTEVVEHRAHKTNLMRYLEEQPGLDLVVVSYAPETNIQVEYVYNGANPDTQSIVWARGHDTADLTPLFKHFKDRTLWSLTVLPKGEPSLVPFKWEPKPAQPAKAEPAPLSPK